MVSVLDQSSKRGTRGLCAAMLTSEASRQQGRGTRSGQPKADAIGGHLFQFYVVHDDKAVQQSAQRSHLGALCLEQNGVRLRKGRGRPLDTALGIQQEVEAPLSELERLDGVRHHAVQPADTVLSRDAEPAKIVEREDARMIE
jgi:hypothetical protein